MENVREHIYLAALLHDIGKFYQRADTGSVSTSKYLSQVNKTESTFLPQHKGVYTHKHCLWTAQFIDDNRSVFRNLIGADSSDLTDRNNLLNLAACHHLKKDQLSPLGQIIKEADCLSSGMDRDSEEAYKDDQDETSWDAFKKKRMVSILETIKKEAFETKWHLPVAQLSLSKTYFPQTDFQSAPDYSILWKNFINDFKFIQANTYRAFSETFLNLLYKYTACIPASTIHFPDVSLYDHAKTTAALAICLYDYQQSGEQSDQPYLLIGADFSGIQSYLYQIVSKYAGKNLKGRSFFLRILSDSVVRHLLKELNLFQANVIYNSGGGFYLIAPNTDYIRKNLQHAADTIEKNFFATFGTSLFVAIDSISISKDALMHKNEENLGKVWGNLFDRKDRKKACKFAAIIERNYNSFFEPIMQGGDVQRDEITGDEFMPNESKSPDEELVLRQDTYSQIQLGKRLRETDYMVVSEEDISYWKDKAINPAQLGFYYYFLNEKELADRQQQLQASADKVSVITFNGRKDGNCDFLSSLNGINNIYGLEFYGGNKFNGQTFEDMAKNPNFSRLGILRMDVDNLGSIFQKGILPERATLSRFAALSRSFDYFFSGYLNTIQQEADREDRSFIIYSGGDDVFIVGSWDITIALAKRIREDFREFACQNSAFSISGGIAIIPAKFPLMKGAKESEGEEHHAKNHSAKGVAKNAISFMDMPLNWDKEFPVVEKLKEEIVELMEKEILPKSFISKISAHWVNAEIEEHKIRRVKTYWMLTYDLSRMKERIKNETAKVLIDNCIAEICTNKSKLNDLPIETNYHSLELWVFAARWAELEYRKDK
jgi:CRISPR-associated protein Csm1